MIKGEGAVSITGSMLRVGDIDQYPKRGNSNNALSGLKLGGIRQSLS